jgi:hypothetical protein
MWPDSASKQETMFFAPPNYQSGTPDRLGWLSSEAEPAKGERRGWQFEDILPVWCGNAGMYDAEEAGLHARPAGRLLVLFTGSIVLDK